MKHGGRIGYESSTRSTPLAFETNWFEAAEQIPVANTDCKLVKLCRKLAV